MNFQRSLLLLLILLVATGQVRADETSTPWRAVLGSHLVRVRLSTQVRQNIDALVNAGPDRTAAAVAPTRSMVPTLDDCCIAIVERRAFEDLRLKDIAVFKRQTTGEVTAHRLVEKDEQVWVTRGDALRRADPFPLTRRNYSGYVVIAAISKKDGQARTL